MSRFARAAFLLLLSIPAAAVAETEETPICTDRPAKGNSVCTVPAGQWQLESAPIVWSRTEADGTETDVLTIGASVLKLGLPGRSDLQIGFAPYVHAETGAGGARTIASGSGDLTVRYKHRLTREGARVQAGVIPFLKLPTAGHAVGNGMIEGGLAVPVSIATASPVTVVLGPELDLLADSDGEGHHAALVNLVNVSAPVAHGLSLTGELWTMTNFDPAGTVTLASADAAIAYLASPKVQIDAGGNFGLTGSTADAELYLGVSLRF